MSIWGYVFMLGSWAAIFIFMIFCIYKELSSLK